MAEPARFELSAYLRRIGLASATPDAEGLAALQAAHMRAIAFENIDPLLGTVPALDEASLVGKLVAGGRGGYCYEQNGLFALALSAVGFSVQRALARVRVRTGVDGPRSHLVLLAAAQDGRRFLTDAGFGGPGPLSPLELGSAGQVAAPNGTYRLEQDEICGETVLLRWRDGAWQELYAFDEARVTDGDVQAANFLAARWDQGPFGSHLTFGCYRGAVRYGLFDRRLTVDGPDGVTQGEITSVDELADALGLPLSPSQLSAIWERIGQYG